MPPRPSEWRCCITRLLELPYLEEVTGGDEERRVLLLVFGALLGQGRQSLQTQLADL